MCTLHSCRQGKAQQPLTALFINSIQERRTHSNQWRATHIHVSASSNQHISLLCAPEMRRFSFVFGRSTTVVATRTTADKHTHTHTCTQCTDGPLLFCSSSEDVSWPTGKSAETTASCFSEETSATSGAHRPAACQAYRLVIVFRPDLLWKLHTGFEAMTTKQFVQSYSLQRLNGCSPSGMNVQLSSLYV